MRNLAAILLLVAASFGTGAPRACVAAVDAAADGDSVVIDPERAWAKVAEARAAAGRDSHHEAVADYLEALAWDARLVPQVAQEIAYQKLWREDAEKAIFYFRRYLARHPGTDDREVRKGLALATSWSGRQPEAVARYRQLVDEDPGDGESRLGLGRSLIWDNRLHEGFTVLREVETGFAADHPARLGTSDFLLTVLDGYTPHLDVTLAASWDSDDLDITRLSATGARAVAGNKLLQVMPAVAWYRQPGQPDVTAPRLGAGVAAALARNWALHAYGWFEHFGSGAPLSGGAANLDWSRLGGDAWVTWLPAPRVRLDGGASSQAIETYDALGRHLHVETLSLSGEWRPLRRWTVGGKGERGAVSDGNTRLRGQVFGKWRREGRVTVSAGPVLTYMDHAEAYPGGYWAPDWVRNASLEATASARGRATTYRLSAGWGLEKEAGAEAQAVGSLAGRVGWRFRPGWLAALEVGTSRSSFASASGYRRTFAGLSVRALF